MMGWGQPRNTLNGQANALDFPRRVLGSMEGLERRWEGAGNGCFLAAEGGRPWELLQKTKRAEHLRRCEAGWTHLPAHVHRCPHGRVHT